MLLLDNINNSVPLGRRPVRDGDDKSRGTQKPRDGVALLCKVGVQAHPARETGVGELQEDGVGAGYPGGRVFYCLLEEVDGFF